jgi:hypothetical protein
MNEMSRIATAAINVIWYCRQLNCTPLDTGGYGESNKCEESYESHGECRMTCVEKFLYAVFLNSAMSGVM